MSPVIMPSFWSQQMTLGEKRVRVTFNPSGDDLVNKIKRKSAELIDLVDEISSGNDSIEIPRLKDLAMTAYEEATIWAVKAATTGK